MKIMEKSDTSTEKPMTRVPGVIADISRSGHALSFVVKEGDPPTCENSAIQGNGTNKLSFKVDEISPFDSKKTRARVIKGLTRVPLVRFTGLYGPGR
jgi:hypothetical protein